MEDSAAAVSIPSKAFVENMQGFSEKHAEIFVKTCRDFEAVPYGIKKKHAVPGPGGHTYLWHFFPAREECGLKEKTVV